MLQFLYNLPPNTPEQAIDKPPPACYNKEDPVQGNLRINLWNTRGEYAIILPDFIFQTITQIRPAFLREHGVRLLLMDFDNTMLPYTTDRPEQPLLDWIAGMQDAGITLCIVSNSHKQRVPHFSQQYHVPCVTHAAKPGTRGIREAMARYGAAPQQTALVGDQIYTDVLGAKRAGITAIAVRSIHNHTVWLKLRHLLELPFLAMARKRRVET